LKNGKRNQRKNQINSKRYKTPSRLEAALPYRKESEPRSGSTTRRREDIRFKVKKQNQIVKNALKNTYRRPTKKY